MNIRLVTSVWLLMFFAPHHVAATGRGNSTISLSAGIVTIDEFKGVTNTSYMDIPYGYSGAIFLSYRYFLTDRVAVGMAVGLDDVRGNLTYGNPKFNGGSDGTAGTYIRHAYTAAPELFIKYMQRGHLMLYGYGGFGYTFSKVEKAYDTRLYANAYQNGVNPNAGYLPYYLSPQNPLYVYENHVNGQLTALGIRVGNTVAWNIEFGFGYKGLINTGLSVNL